MKDIGLQLTTCRVRNVTKAAEQKVIEAQFIERLHIAAQWRAAAIGIDRIDYLIGILEGQFPRIPLEELEMAELATGSSSQN